MNYQISRPSSFLEPFIKQFWAIEECLIPCQSHIQRIIPSGFIELTFYFGNKPVSLDTNKCISENIILSGHQKNYYDVLITGRLSMFSVSFQPYGAKLLFDIPSNELYDQNIPLKYLLKNKVSELECRLYETVSFREKIIVIEEFLLNLLHNGNKHYETQRMINSIGIVNRTFGMIDIDTLASLACLSRKQYERIFAEYIGSSPKQFLRTIRFQKSLLEKQRNRDMSLTELAYICGYSDQSHMINEYKILSGKRPGRYFSECEPWSDYFHQIVF